MANKKISCGGFSVDNETIIEENGVLKAVDKSTTVIANPELIGTEDALNGLQVGETKYSVPAPTTVIANPTLAGTEAALTGLQVGDTKYSVGGSSSIIHSTVASGESSPYTLSIEETASEILAMEFPVLSVIAENIGTILFSTSIKASADDTTELSFVGGTYIAAIVIINGEITIAELTTVE